MKILAGIHDVTQCVSEVCQVHFVDDVFTHGRASNANKPSDLTVIKYFTHIGSVQHRSLL